MNKKTNQEDISQESSGHRRARDDILDAVRESKPIFEKRKRISTAPPPKSSERDDFEEIANSLDIWQGSSKYTLLKFFYEEKSATAFDCRVLARRSKNFSDEQLEILKLLCTKDGFTVKRILDFIKPIRKFGINRLLTLRAFVDLQDLNPAFLDQFFRANLPSGNRKEMGAAEWENELMEMMMNSGQIDVFYNICNRLTGITPKTAINILPKIRRLKTQHIQFVNHFLKEDSCFGDQPIGDNNISGLINLWLVIPELDNKHRFKRLLKAISRKPDEKKKDFLFIIKCLKEELDKDKRNSFENIILSIRDFWV